VSSKLANDLVVRPPSVTAVVDGLVARGCVTRRHAEDDRRRVSHELTPEGRALLVRADEVVNHRLADIAATLEDPVAARRAVDGLVLWRTAIRAYGRRGEEPR
jgi:DNA-binding MarR family transcriptional regulator